MKPTREEVIRYMEMLGKDPSVAEDLAACAREAAELLSHPPVGSRWALAGQSDDFQMEVVEISEPRVEVRWRVSDLLPWHESGATESLSSFTDGSLRRVES